MQRFVAKRYRIVNINFPLLEQGGAEFTVTPFDDLQVKLKAERTFGPSSGGQLREWVGSLDTGGDSLTGTTPDGKTVVIPELPVRLWVRTGDHEVPLKVARRIAAERGETARLKALPELSNAPGAPLTTTKLPLQTLSGDWVIRSKGKQVAIRPIEDDPRYHIVYEVDGSKLATASHGNEESTRRLRAIAQFREQLDRERAQEEAVRP